MKNVILDVDTGIDDAIALIMAIKSKELNIIGITTVTGNVTAKQAAINTAGVLKLINESSIPVICGAERSLSGENSQTTHTQGSLFKVLNPIDTSIYKYNKSGAVDFLIDSILNYKDTGITLILTAPLTNIALAIKKAPGIKEYINEAIIMGGANECSGNITPYAEFNFYKDSEAANLVLNSGIDISLITLDVTNKVILTERDMENIMDINIKNFINEITSPLMDRYERKFGIRGCLMHDPLTVAYAIDESFICTNKFKVNVVTEENQYKGQAVCKDDVTSRTNISTDVDEERFKKLFFTYINLSKTKRKPPSSVSGG